MALPAPNLDDRRFQDLVDDAKRMVQRRCPEWTDHNVSDPGITLIETFAYLTDQLMYRLNRVPDRLYVKFLELIGLRMLPPTASRVPLTFWLSTPAQTEMTIATGARAGTIRTETEESIVFSTAHDLRIVPCTLQYVRTLAAGAEESLNCTDRLTMKTPFPAFAEPPSLGDTLLLGLSEAVPHCAIRLDFDGRIEGVGVNPKEPPLRWEAWTGQDWTECEFSDDETGGLNRSGAVTVHVPGTHEVSVLDGERAGWLRARVIEPLEGQPPYSASPIVHDLSACTVGGTMTAINAEIVLDEALGQSDGVPGQIFPVQQRPILFGVEDPIVEVSGDEGWQVWQPVEHFADSGPADRHFILDSVAGEVILGPMVRQPDGTLRYYGAVPPPGASVRIRRYVIGGGSRGNVAVGAVRTLRSSIPFVAAVENRHPGHGGVEGETLEEAKKRGPLLLRTRNRAVTAEDYELLAREAAPEAARIRCVPAGMADVEAGAVKVLVTPAAPVVNGRINFPDLVPSEQMLARIATRLDQVRLVGTRVMVEPPLYRGVTVVARVVARPRVNAARMREAALLALYEFLNPLTGGGPDQTGWPYGRPVQAGDIFAVLQRVRGVDLIEDVRLFTANPVTGERGHETARIDVDVNSLVFSFGHQVRVEEN